LRAKKRETSRSYGMGSTTRKKTKKKKMERGKKASRQEKGGSPEASGKVSSIKMRPEPTGRG